MAEYMFIHGPIGVKTTKFIGVKSEGEKVVIKGDPRGVEYIKKLLSRSLVLAQSFTDKDTLPFDQFAWCNKYTDIQTFEPSQNDEARKKFDSMDGSLAVIFIKRVPTRGDKDFDKKHIKDFYERKKKMMKQRPKGEK